MGRRYIGNTRVATSTVDFWDDHSLIVHGSWNQLGISSGESQTGAWIPWFFGQHPILGIQENVRRDLQGLLRAGRNQDL
jgi:hypothetical protein